jgi:putative cardiolipin synthase
MRGHLELIRSAQSEVLIASPYFVPGKSGLAAIRQALDRNVELSVMTNSLATTDEPLVHYGYAKYRGALLNMGAKLYELMPEAGDSGERAAEDSSFGRSGMHGSLGRLHAKLAVVDAQRVFIGSMNMDRRSAHSNTEIALIIESDTLAVDLANMLRRERLPRSYRLRIANATGGIEWVATQGHEQVVQVREPVGSASIGLGLRLSRGMVPEDWL